MPNNFEFSQNYVLEDERVVLEPLNGNNSTHLLHFSINEPNIWKYSLVQVAGEDNFKKYIADAGLSREQKLAYPFIVYDKKLGQYAGSTRFYDIQLNNQSLQLGYTWYGSQFQGTGLNRHCKYLLLQFAFEKMGMERVEFRADKNNARSIAAMRGIGCTIEGILRNHTSNAAGGRRDSIILSILRQEWFGGVKEQLERKMKDANPSKPA